MRMDACLKAYESTENFGRIGVNEIAEIKLSGRNKEEFFDMEIAGKKYVVNGLEFREALKAFGFLYNMIHVNYRIEKEN